MRDDGLARGRRAGRRWGGRRRRRRGGRTQHGLDDFIGYTGALELDEGVRARVELPLRSPDLLDDDGVGEPGLDHLDDAVVREHFLGDAAASDEGEDSKEDQGGQPGLRSRECHA